MLNCLVCSNFNFNCQDLALDISNKIISEKHANSLCDAHRKKYNEVIQKIKKNLSRKEAAIKEAAIKEVEKKQIMGIK